MLTCALGSSLWVLCAKPPGLGLFQANVQVHSFTQEQWSVSVSVLATFCEIKQANIQHHSSSQTRISHKLAPSLFSKTQNSIERAAESFPCIPNCPLNGLMGSINAHKLSTFSLFVLPSLLPSTSLLTMFLPLLCKHTHTHTEKEMYFPYFSVCK